ncbi:dual CXXC motif small (seleno)protein [Desulfococcus sp.]
MRCRSCSRRFTIEQIADALDDDLEELLANIPCNRL